MILIEFHYIFKDDKFNFILIATMSTESSQFELHNEVLEVNAQKAVVMMSQARLCQV